MFFLIPEEEIFIFNIFIFTYPQYWDISVQL